MLEDIKKNKKKSTELCIDFIGAVEIVFDQYLKKSALIKDINLFSEFLEKNLEYASTYIKDLKATHETDQDALFALKEKVTEFCEKNKKFTRDEKESLMKIIKEIEDPSVSKDSIETNKIKKITSDIKDFSEKQKKLAEKVVEQESNVEKTHKELKEAQEIMPMLYQLRENGELSKDIIETQEKKLITLEADAENAKKELKCTQEEEQDINNKILEQKNVREKLVREAQKRFQQEDEIMQATGPKSKEARPSSPELLDDFRSYIYNKPGKWQGDLTTAELNEMLEIITASDCNHPSPPELSWEDQVDIDRMAHAIVQKKDIEKLDRTSSTIISDMKHYPWLEKVIKVYTNEKTDASLSQSLLDYMPNYAYNFFSPELMSKIGALSPHNVSAQLMNVLDDNQIKIMLFSYREREDKKRVFSKSTEEALTKRNFNL
jgi:hypothetical protein